jgi:hypothetical protein
MAFASDSGQPDRTLLTFTSPVYKLQARAGRGLLISSNDVTPSHEVRDACVHSAALHSLPQNWYNSLVGPTIGCLRGSS